MDLLVCCEPELRCVEGLRGSEFVGAGGILLDVAHYFIVLCKEY